MPFCWYYMTTPWALYYSADADFRCFWQHYFTRLCWKLADYTLQLRHYISITMSHAKFDMANFTSFHATSSFPPRLLSLPRTHIHNLKWPSLYHASLSKVSLSSPHCSEICQYFADISLLIGLRGAFYIRFGLYDESRLSRNFKESAIHTWFYDFLHGRSMTYFCF